MDLQVAYHYGNQGYNMNYYGSLWIAVNAARSYLWLIQCPDSWQCDWGFSSSLQHGCVSRIGTELGFIFDLGLIQMLIQQWQ